MNTIRARTESESRRRQIFVYRCNYIVNEAFLGRYPITFGMLNLLHYAKFLVTPAMAANIGRLSVKNFKWV